MIRIDINLATDRRKRRLLPLFAVAVAVAAAMLMSWNTVALFEANERKSVALKEEAERLEARFDPTALGRGGYSVKEVRALADEVDFINGLIVRETFSWTSLLSDLEMSVPGGISIATISPDFERMTIGISGMGESMEKVLSFVDALDSSKRFSDVFLVSHAESKLRVARVKTKGFISFVLTTGYGKGEGA